MSMFIIEFKSNFNEDESTFLKVKLPTSIFNSNSLSDLIEFDLYLEGINSLNPGMDVTVNWKCVDMNNTDGLFYTDENGLEILKRKTDYYTSRYHN